MELFHDRKHDLLVYRTAHPDWITQSVQQARRVNGEVVVVPRTLHNAQLLRLLDMPVPPVMEGYDWPAAPPVKPYATQKLVANFLALHPRSFDLSDMGCVDAETEYLSPTGWKRIDEYDGGLVTQWHIDGSTSLVQPNSYIAQPCEWFYHFKTTRGVNQKLTPEHRVLYVHNGQLRIAIAVHVVSAQENLALGWRGKFITAFKGGQAGITLSAADLRLMVAVIADGHFPGKSNRCIINVKKERKKSRLRALLSAAQVEFKEKDLPYASKKGYTLFSFMAPRREKVFTSYYWTCSYAQLQIVTDECWRWDGSIAKGNRGPSFCSTEKDSADFIQYAFSATGYTASVNLQNSSKRTPHLWLVTTRTKSALIGLNGIRDDGSKTAPISIVPAADGKKYCFEVPSSFLVLRRGGCIFVTGNSGKTLASLWAADWLMSHHPPGTFRALIVAPLSVLQRVWGDALFRHFLDRRSFAILHGDAQRRQKLLDEPRDFYIVNHDGVAVGARTYAQDRTQRKSLVLDGFAKQLAERDDIRLAIVDEASAYSDAQTRRHRVAREVIGKRDYLWLLTGTPTRTAPTDAYGLAKLVNNAHGKSQRAFRAESMVQISQFKWVPQRDGYEKARRLLQPAVRIDIKEVWDGPPCTTQQREVPLTDAQKRLLADLKRNLRVALHSGALIVPANEAAARGKFLQIAAGAVYDENHMPHDVDAEPRYAEAEAVINESGRKIVIFVPLTSIVHKLHNRLSRQWGTAFINGEVGVKERAEIIGRFASDDSLRVVICDPATTAHGINEFVAADTTLWFGPTDKAELYQQGNKRVNRPGQKYPTTVVQLVSNPLEREIYRRLEAQEALQGALLDMVRREEL